MRYRHTQTSLLNLALLAIPAVVCIWIFLTTSQQPWGWLTLGGAGLFIGLSICFFSLTIAVDAERVALRFGPGWIRKSWPIEECRSASHVTTSLWEGWGIRLTRRGWLYNIAIPDAVMIRLRNGTAVQLGTDEPAELLAAMAEHGIPTTKAED